ncbi:MULTISPECIES: flagella synthesis protein FlgN [Aliivibrio]|jgi:flagella synthesis protein FlgN|uniref:Flagellar protein FlgN n=1 Tax=Aliivibrio finisterrensis TaxID=511998 RepID=A0A4Q5KR56_9GAMM|nr:MULTISPECIES: flagellar export chaperone FlgN [Aliivibrio]MDD9180197.1 flagellar export chaperone FlgN [Aliivibrio sp. A6]RYU49460.1 flagellar protein FlgN [Aliivibrio finisterrensis]RYU49895.1 flagellar protein FlgN [Aliivibrio finisterrensis]RYU55651.1 flagellar protein FlgN [Aliivibrio finisterrensis]RYU62105.1 flagellar protein FlgN [Aliivibrio finisterrensis]
MAQTLTELLDLQRSVALSLSTVLHREKHAIASRKPAEMEGIAHDKLGLLNQLRQYDQLLGSHAERQLLSEDNALTEKVTEIKSIIHDCKEENAVNGEALQRAQLSFNKLNNLMQQSRGKNGMTYTAEGQTRNITTLGTNVKA